MDKTENEKNNNHSVIMRLDLSMEQTKLRTNQIFEKIESDQNKETNKRHNIVKHLPRIDTDKK